VPMAADLPPRRRCFGVALGLALASVSVTARAASPLLLDIEPVLGGGSPAVDGWMSAHVRIENRSGEVVRGTLAVESQVAWSRGPGGPRNGTDVPFSVAARSQVSVEVPVHGFPGIAPSLSVAARSEAGQVLAEAKSAELRTHDPLIFDLSSPSHFAPAVRQLGVPLSNTRWGGLASPLVSVSSARQDARTGEPVVPHTASGYASATVVLATSAELQLIGEEARAALSDWLLAGGALAVVPERPEDFHAPYLESWAGGSVYEQAAPDELRGQAVFAMPIDPGSGARPSGIAELRLTPSAESRTRLRGFGGGNLRSTPWGAAASYGLGELHLLAFRPNAEPFASDPWTHHKLADLTRHAWDRSASVALPYAQARLDESRLLLVRRELDPNQGTRWTIVVSALLLLAYAGVAGPLNFYLARRAGKPLRALWRLPLVASLARKAGCPIGDIDAADFERLRAQKLRGEVGSRAPRSRPALRFELGKARRAEVERWVRSVSSACRTGFVTSVLECDDVRLAPSIAHLRLEFDAEARLVSVDSFRAGGAPGELVSAFVETSRELTERVGAATSSAGEPTVEFATSRPLALVTRSFAYRDYVATVTLVNLGKRGLRLREQYGFLPRPA